MTRMNMVTLLFFCVPSCWCCEDWEFQRLLQRNEQLQRDMAALLREMEELQTKAVGRGLQETPLECCPCNHSGAPNVTVLSHYENESNTTRPLQDSSWQVTSGTTTNPNRQLTSGTTTNPHWRVVSGDCVLDDDDCLTDPEINQVCDIEILDEWVGTLAVHDVPSAASQIALLVNGAYYSQYIPEYYGPSEFEPLAALDGVVPYGTIMMFTGSIITENASLKICRSNTTYTNPNSTTNPQYWHDYWHYRQVDYGATTNPYWRVVYGDCVLDDDDCLTSQGSNQFCEIEILDEWVGTVAVHGFPSASTDHQLIVNGVYYSTSEQFAFFETPAALDGVVPYGTIQWYYYRYSNYYPSPDTTDDDVSFKICRSDATYEWTYWTCTVLGDDCTGSVSNNPDITCSMWYSDSRDRGHSWCMAPTAYGFEQAQACGPCSCLAGEAQTYNSRVLADNWGAHEYIVCTPCVPGTFKSVGGFGADDLCSSCSAGQHTSTHGATACDFCEAGRFAASNGSTHCAECGVGHFSADGASVCEPCAEGRFGTSAGSSLCLCDAGYYRTDDMSSVCEACSAGHWSKADASICEPCNPGHFAPGEGSISCLPCAAGQFSATNNSTTCEDCVIGRFGTDSGMDQCEGCYDVLSPGGANPQLWTTMREELWNGELVLLPVAGADTLKECGCDAGAWMSLDSQCYECGEGVLCKGLGEVIVMEGYFAPSNDAGDVWKCHGIEQRCPGGSPGTCARNRVNTSLACGECTLGTRATTSGACEECGSGQPWLMALAALFLLVGLCVVYFVIAREDRAKEKDSVALIAIIVSQVVTAIQVLGILDLLLVVWPEPFASFLVVSSVLHFDLDVLSPNCVVSMPALMSYGITVFGFVLMLSLLILIHCVSVIVFFGGRCSEGRTIARSVDVPKRIVSSVGSSLESVCVALATQVECKGVSPSCLKVHMRAPANRACEPQFFFKNKLRLY